MIPNPQNIKTIKEAEAWRTKYNEQLDASRSLSRKISVRIRDIDGRLELLKAHAKIKELQAKYKA